MSKKEMHSKIIFLEGLPSTGKSTNSRILLSQFESNGYHAKWVHEMARPHPTLFFYESCLTYNEYQSLVQRYPNSSNILNRVKRTRNKYIAFDLLEIEWNRFLDEEVLHALKQFDVWNFPLEKYIDVALDKWEDFAQQIRKQDQIILLDSSIFQFQIYTFLLENASFSLLETFLSKIYGLLREFNPVLIYFYRDNVNDTITYMEEDRGIQFFINIWERDQHLPYYQNRPKGANGYKEFLRDYQKTAEKLFEIFPFKKLPFEISEGNWSKYVQMILSELEIILTEISVSSLPVGKYVNEELGFEIRLEGSFMIDPTGTRKCLYKKTENEYYIENLPVILYLETPDKLVIKGEQLCDRWTTLGLVYRRIDF
ncbi:hypothetical protein AN964_16390 [Heyndrickxia shackletonii]|uniref:Uncharacterized protein n=1 Tax=Heyndrickxia shackletonii TaxID=157838 RepID=A0A0Q3WZL8_9BACI|nr:hypothetical protein [Heyndrickxia shackletonii]KQL54923.1 hypothetical protein AN964_16390 [Heyndrickxia shackletonii]MBB2482545.1 hypothetical protein [Bacillus sp. APMAM]NEY99405.1 hypothetical protein [Heyndrickxia shackletonii]RTZ54040.1 hypothetical protein EKO25_20200 [Bacillus sp. SAJ1]